MGGGSIYMLLVRQAPAGIAKIHTYQHAWAQSDSKYKFCYFIIVYRACNSSLASYHLYLGGCNFNNTTVVHKCGNPTGRLRILQRFGDGLGRICSLREPGADIIKQLRLLEPTGYSLALKPS